MAQDQPGRGRRAGRGRAILKWAELDRAVLFGILAQVWGMVSGPVTVLLIAGRFSPELQGIHYTFLSLLGVSVLVELGLNQVIVQFASHEWPNLHISASGGVVGDADAFSRLAGLLRLSLRWYACGAGLLCLGMTVGGIIFFSLTTDAPGHWLAPWIALCVSHSLLLTTMPLWALLEGCGQLPRVFGMRLAQGVLVSLTLWGSIALGAGLWTAFAGSFCGLVVSGSFLAAVYGRFFASLRAAPAGRTLDWKREVLPLQWRVAVTYVSGYFSSMLFTPIIFMYDGPVAAGRMGMSWTLVTSLSSVSMMLIITKVPRFGALISQRRFADLDRLFVKAVGAAVGVAAFGSVSAVALLMILKVYHVRFATRLLSVPEISAFLATTVLAQIVIGQAMYLRAHRKEPLLWVSVASGFLIVAAALIIGRYYGAAGVGATYLGVVALWAVPASTQIWLRCREEWHAPPSPG